jgi:hypothetical protein
MIWLREDEIEILQSLSQPKALHLIILFRFALAHIIDRRMTKIRPSRLVNVLEHAPRSIQKSLVSSNPIHDENRLECLRSEYKCQFEDLDRNMKTTIKHTEGYTTHHGYQ